MLILASDHLGLLQVVNVLAGIAGALLCLCQFVATAVKYQQESRPTQKDKLKNQLAVWFVSGFLAIVLGLFVGVAMLIAFAILASKDTIMRLGIAVFWQQFLQGVKLMIND